MARYVAARTADGQDGVRLFSHSNQVFCRPMGAWKMEMSKLANRVPGAFVDGTRHFTPLDMSDANIHISGGDGRGEGFVSITDQENKIRLQALKLAGKFYNSEPNGLCHGDGS